VVTTVGIVSPGAMGSAVGAAYLAGGSRVVATVDGRSARTARLAREAGLELLPDLAAVVRASDLLLSIVPPGQAEATGAAVAGCDRSTLLVEANAVSPGTVSTIASYGLPVVDGSISGGPPAEGDAVRTRLYLSGPRAGEVAQVPAPWLDVRVVGPALGTASAVKMCTASYYKGRAALAAHALLTAQEHGVTDVVLDDLGALLPGAHSVALATTKAWRFVDEMREIAATQAAAGLPGAVFEGMAQAYEELARRVGQLAPEDVPADVDWPALLGSLR
jgi:3-hydroxyisobutyrate dehydrogenase-like beta-hydroxyacid dehydrogenase